MCLANGENWWFGKKIKIGKKISRYHTEHISKRSKSTMFGVTKVASKAKKAPNFLFKDVKNVHSKMAQESNLLKLYFGHH